jgi:hypothetical protein
MPKLQLSFHPPDEITLKYMDGSKALCKTIIHVILDKTIP